MKGWTLRRARDPVLGEEIVRAKRPGLPVVWHCRRRGILEKFALVGVSYGSIHQRFRLAGTSRWIATPAGVAHFLEHQLFEGVEANAFEFFSHLGASANAYTDFSETAYHVECVDRFGDAFAHLLRFVREPHFTDASVAKERGVIAQEIRMYSDDADSVCVQNLHKALFARHPARQDIAGTARSIRGILPETLETCYWAFYHPARMAVVVAADLPLGEVLGTVERSFSSPAGRQPRPWREGRPAAVLEPAGVARPRIASRMPVARPRALIGFKDGPARGSGKERVRRRVELSLAGEILFGAASRFHQEADADGIIEEDFGFSHQAFPDLGYCAAGGSTASPGRLRRRILSEIRRAARRGVDRGDFERVRTKAAGDFLRVFHSPAALGSILASCHFAGSTLFDYRDALRRVRRIDLERRIRASLRPERSTMSVILPR